MFGKRQVKGGSAVTVIAAGTVVEGKISVKGLIQVDGVVHGSVVGEGEVSVGPEGRVVGDVTAERLCVGGTIDGKVVARSHLHVLSTGRVHGELCYGTLQVDRGGVMDGRASSSSSGETDIPAALAADNDREVTAHEAAE